ncbi:ubiquinone biosynthesis protein UbiA [Natronomonas sp. CBA1123]|uniref:UbiA family prenyltransferase n=1 Tax=Natronomonas sp. CBA1123 TaxID=2668070 RepID=UPI0012EA4748|nr:UbiA family prenyltransferase [Natronomonas sp. CBA1123]MUV87564.1 ubiquinone biosynthesis protein UbiA [Natronomonas sp. CBA1123]
MEIARHGTGLRADVGALASQIHPVFMLPPVAASAFGAVLSGRLDVTLLALHLVAAFAALYTAHIKDGYVDFHGRGEDDDHPLTASGCRFALAGASTVFFTCLLAIGLLVDVWAALLTLPGWVIGYLHAPQLDLNPVGATAGYPAGIAFALLGGYYVQATTLTTAVVAFAVVFLLVLSGIKTIDDAKDYEYDRSIGKRTVAVVLGRRRARLFAYGLMAVGMVVVVALAVLGVFPPASVFAPVVFAVVAAFAWRAGEDASLATKLLIRGSYLFLAVLVAAVWLG